MLKLCAVLNKRVSYANTTSVRWISALYITGDKANENYVTIQPYMDFAGTFRQRQDLQESIEKRKLNINLDQVLEKYSKYEEFKEKLQLLENERESITKLLKSVAKSSGTAELIADTLKERGKTLRNKVKALKHSLYPIEDDFIHDFLNLPNKLHASCPINGNEKLLYRSQLAENCAKNVKSHLQCKELVHFIDDSCYYMLDAAAHFDVQSGQALTRYFVKHGGFLQTANPDFVRCVLLEANATPFEYYNMVKEEQLQNKLNLAYLTGGGSFESYLGAMTKLCVYPSILPLRLVCLGRSYNCAAAVLHKGTSSLYTATQSNAVQTFVATETASEADVQLENILNMTVDFYKGLNVPFRVVYVNASDLTPAECLRANIEVYAPSLRRYVCVGHVSNYSDFVSKRILFSMRHEKNYCFLHLVGGPVLYTTRLIAALIENGISLSDRKLLGNISTNSKPLGNNPTSAIDEFKNIFK